MKVKAAEWASFKANEKRRDENEFYNAIKNHPIHGDDPHPI